MKYNSQNVSKPLHLCSHNCQSLEEAVCLSARKLPTIRRVLSVNLSMNFNERNVAVHSAERIDQIAVGSFSRSKLHKSIDFVGWQDWFLCFIRLQISPHVLQIHTDQKSLLADVRF